MTHSCCKLPGMEMPAHSPALPLIGALVMPPSYPLGDDAIRSLLRRHIDIDRKGTGAVVALIQGDRQTVVCWGRMGITDHRRVDGDTVFEIGSVTKGFTGLLLSDMVQRGEASLTHSATGSLPADVFIHDQNVRSISLLDLATHTSSLPPLPDNGGSYDPGNPYAAYSVGQLYAFLSAHRLGSQPGTGYEYSNLGAGLLGHVLSLRLGMDFESALKERIFKPLYMPSTAISHDSDFACRLAPGHDKALRQVPNWDIPTLAGTGALRSTANDLLTFLRFATDNRSSDLACSLSAQIKVRRAKGNQGNEIALGWQVRPSTSGELIWHNGGTGGYRSYLGFDRANRIGVAALSNGASPGGVDSLALAVLGR